MSEHKNDADIQQMDTYTLESMLANVRNLEEYEAIMQQARSQNEIWKEEITALMMETDLTRDRFAKLVAEGCNVGRATAYNLASKAPAKRENVLGIAVLTGRTIDQTNEMLREWAGFSGLYARNADDMIWYYLVMHGANPHPYALFQAYHAVYQKLFQAYQSKPEPERRPDEGRADAAFARLKTPPVKTILAENILEEAAAEYALTVEGAADDAVFADIVDRLLPLMQGAYERLFARLETLCDCKPDQALFWDSERFLGTYRRCMERFCREQVLPKRSFLIALGIHLGLKLFSICTGCSFLKLLDFALYRFQVKYILHSIHQIIHLTSDAVLETLVGSRVNTDGLIESHIIFDNLLLRFSLQVITVVCDFLRSIPGIALTIKIMLRP